MNCSVTPTLISNLTLVYVVAKIRTQKEMSTDNVQALFHQGSVYSFYCSFNYRQGQSNWADILSKAGDKLISWKCISKLVTDLCGSALSMMASLFGLSR